MIHADPVALALSHAELRGLFPSLAQKVNGQTALFLDGPGGTQMPLPVMEAMTTYLARDNANLGGAFATSRRTVEGVAAARYEVAEFLHASRPEEILFGQNMTSLTFSLSHALRRTWKTGDEVIVSSLDHDANIATWTQAAADAGAVVRTWEFDRETFHLRLGDLEGLLNKRTRLVAFTHASNIIGSIPDVAGAIRLVRTKAPGAMVFIDAVHYTPHHPVDVRALDCDFLACSAYKFCGPHLGILYGKYEHLDRLHPYKVSASTNVPPGKWETGNAELREHRRFARVSWVSCAPGKRRGECRANCSRDECSSGLRGWLEPSIPRWHPPYPRIAALRRGQAVGHSSTHADIWDHA